MHASQSVGAALVGGGVTALACYAPAGGVNQFIQRMGLQHAESISKQAAHVSLTACPPFKQAVMSTCHVHDRFYMQNSKHPTSRTRHFKPN